MWHITLQIILQQSHMHSSSVYSALQMFSNSPVSWIITVLQRIENTVPLHNHQPLKVPSEITLHTTNTSTKSLVPLQQHDVATRRSGTEATVRRGTQQMKRDGARYVAYDEIQRWNDDTSNTTGVDDVERTDMKQLEEELAIYHNTRWLAEMKRQPRMD